jgi:hypothetical protein
MIFRVPFLRPRGTGSGAGVVTVTALYFIAFLVVIISWFNLDLLGLESEGHFAIAVTGATCGIAFQA